VFQTPRQPDFLNGERIRVLRVNNPTDRSGWNNHPLSRFRQSSQQVMMSVLFLVISTVMAEPLMAVDAIDRLASERLKAVHLAIEKLNSERHEISRPGPLKDYRANLHVHSAFSHDSRGTIEEIVAAAKATNTSVLMFTDHPANHYDVFADGHQGMRDGVLLIPGAETNGMLLYPRDRINAFLSEKPQQLADIVTDREGLAFVSHLEERMDWNLTNITGVEIYNTHADAKDEKRLFASIRNPLWVMNSADLFREYPQEAFSSLQDYPADYLKRWDELCSRFPHTGVSANDSHQNLGLTIRLADDNKVRLEDALGKDLLTLDTQAFRAFKPIPADAKVGDILFQLRLDAYENSLRHVGTHLLMTDLSQPEVWQALKQGHAFVAFDWLTDATGFDFAAIVGDTRHEMGSSLKLKPGLQFIGQSPLAAHWKLMRNAQLFAESDGDRLVKTIDQAGIYRVELWLNVAEESRLWVLSNPIYVNE